MIDPTSRAWIDVRADALARNHTRIQERLPAGCRTIPMVKADAYGLGVGGAVRTLEPHDPLAFGVATPAEALELRALGVARPIYVFSPLAPHAVPALLDADAIGCISDLGALQALADAAANRRGSPVRFQVEIDTGMGRAGFDAARAADWVPGVRALESERCRLEGCYTHFHSADEGEPRVSEEQWRSFVAAANELERDRPGPRLLRHAANSAGIVAGVGVVADAVRPGIRLYGGGGGSEPVASVRARILLVREVPAGSTVGYGATYRAERPERWATVGIGYGDGLRRALGNRGHGLLGGYRIPIVGRISMDMTVVDITGVEGGEAGDVVTFLGSDGSAEISLGEMASAVGTIDYEILTGFTRRLPRIWT